MTTHPLTSKARNLLSQHAALDVAFLQTLNSIIADKVYAAEGYATSFAYCVEALGLSEDSAWRRCKAADLLARYPTPVRRMIETREIHLTGLAMLHKVINDDNYETVLNAARGQSKRAIELLVVTIEPKPVPKPVITKLATPALKLTASTQGEPEKVTAPVRPQQSSKAIELLNIETYRLHINMPPEMKKLLDRIVDLSTDRDLTAIVFASFEARLTQLESQKRRALKRNPKPAAPVRDVAANDESPPRIELADDAARPHGETAVAKTMTPVDGMSRPEVSDSDNTMRLSKAFVSNHDMPRPKAFVSDNDMPPPKALGSDDCTRALDALGSDDDTHVLEAFVSDDDSPIPKLIGSDNETPLRNAIGSDVMPLAEAIRLRRDVRVGPQGRTRYVPAAIARAVYERDGGRCTFVGFGGRVCGTTRNVQLHHRDAFAKGGPTTEANLTCHCKTHNLYQAELEFGPRGAA
jgi:hypothetical protein